MTSDDNRARSSAKAAYDSLAAMVLRLEHSRECDGSGCQLSDTDILAGLGLGGNQATEDQREEYHDEDGAHQAIREDPLSIEVRSDWTPPGENMGPMEYQILLSTGGPAVRITGDLDDYCEPSSARLEYQDWGTQWTGYYPLSSEETGVLLDYARCFYFGR